ncbi:hypothetical protein Q5H91_13500, partial [Sphingomonas sp. KR1UV-12]
MASVSRAFRVSLIPLLLLSTAPLHGRPVAPPPKAKVAPAKPAPAPAPVAPAPVPLDTSAWLYKGSDIEPDAAWSFGTLPN